jgi:hypothetical protein
MGKYGRAAVQAAELLRSGKFREPRAAWDAAVGKIFPDSASAQNKCCPRDAFLSLCELGLVDSVAPGRYTRSVKNKSYVMRAVELLRVNPELSNNENELWRAVLAGERKAPNHQMEVVVTIIRRG